MEKTGLCLSIRQPWAHLIVIGEKPVENRDWPTKVRGWIGVHAAQKFDREGYEWIRRHFPHIQMPEPEGFQRGGIVGKALLTDCVTAHPSSWFFGRYGFVMRLAEPLPFQPCRGKLGFFRPEFTSRPPHVGEEGRDG